MSNEANVFPKAGTGRIEPHLFRGTMGAFATGVTIITVDNGASTHAMTANAFMSGSLEPPLCVVSIAKRANTHRLMRGARRFGVNVLRSDQQDLALFFAGKKTPHVEARFQRVLGVPLLRECVARIAAKVKAEFDCGDHTLFIGAILFMDSNDQPPLVYHSGAFGALAPKARGKHETIDDLEWIDVESAR